MDLQRKFYRICTVVQLFPILLFCSVFILFSGLPAAAQSRSARPPELIRDTDAAEAKDSADKPAVKEPNPILSEQNINIGNFYFKKKNYAAAIGRYLEAVEYQPDSASAYDALARAYEKNDEPAKAIAAYKQFLEKNPGSPKSAEFRTKLAKLEKTTK
jgi:tetratricopeptide (TPR) repeat protein